MVEPDHIRIVMDIPRRQVVLVPGLEGSSQEIDGLVERVDCNDGLEIWPQRLKHLVTSRRQIRAGYQETEKRQNFATQFRAEDGPLSNRDCHASQVFNKNRRCQPSSQSSPQLRIRQRSLEALCQRPEHKHILFGAHEIKKACGRGTVLANGPDSIPERLAPALGS